MQIVRKCTRVVKTRREKPDSLRREAGLGVGRDLCLPGRRYGQRQGVTPDPLAGVFGEQTEHNDLGTAVLTVLHFQGADCGASKGEDPLRVPGVAEPFFPLGIVPGTAGPVMWGSNCCVEVTDVVEAGSASQGQTLDRRRRSKLKRTHHLHVGDCLFHGASPLSLPECQGGGRLYGQ